MSKLRESFSHDVYLFLINTLRELDIEEQNGLLERYLFGVQDFFENFQNDVDEFPKLWDAETIPDDRIDYLLVHLGFTKELDRITSDLTVTQKRKLLLVAVALWKTKGTEQGLRDSLRIITGREVIIWNFFHLRWTLAVSGLQRIQSETDSILLGNTYGAQDEHFSVIWVSRETGDDKQFIADVSNLHRPMRESYHINYAVFVDGFGAGASKWTVIGGAPTWNSTNFNYVIPPANRVRVNVPEVAATKDLISSCTVGFPNATGGSFSIYARQQTTGTLDYYKITFAQTGVVTVRQSVGGVVTTIGVGNLEHLIPVDETTEFGLRVFRSRAGQLTIAGLIYGKRIIAVVVNEPIIAPGEWDFENDGTGNLILDNVILNSDGAPYAIVDDTQSKVFEGKVLNPGAFVLMSVDVSTYTLSSLWHASQYRFTTPPDSIYFGTGEVGWFEQPGTKGTMGGIIAAGSAVSPTFNASAYPASKYKYYLHWYQFIEIRADPNDQMVIEILDGAVIQQTITKAQLVALGSGYKRMEVTAGAAGKTAVQVRFSANTVAVPGTEEGWFVDDVSVRVEEI